MVESQGKIQLLPGEDSDLLGVIPGGRLAFGPGDENSGDGMVAGIALGFRVSMHLTLEPDIQRRFFLGFPDGCLFEGFAVFHKSPWKSPSERRVLAFDENDPRQAVFSFYFDDDIDCGKGISMFVHGRPRYLCVVTPGQKSDFPLSRIYGIAVFMRSVEFEFLFQFG